MNAYIQHMMLTSDFHSPLRCFFFFFGRWPIEFQMKPRNFFGVPIGFFINQGWWIRGAFAEHIMTIKFGIHYSNHPDLRKMSSLQNIYHHLSVDWWLWLRTSERVVVILHGGTGWDLYICRMAPWRWESLKHGDVGCHSSMAPVVKWSPKIRGLFWN